MDGEQKQNVVQIHVEPNTRKVLVQFLQCSACPVEFADPLHRVAHINIAHPRVMQKEAWTPCAKCLMRFPRKDVLKEHMRRTHHGGSRSKCLICDQVFWSDTQFRRHWRYCVTKWAKNARPDEPMDAAAAAVNRQGGKHKPQQEQIVEQEVETVPLPPPDYTCAFCGQCYKTKELYMEHTKSGRCSQQPQHPGKYKNTNPVPCYYCSAHCASRHALQAHIRDAHQVVPIKTKVPVESPEEQLEEPVKQEAQEDETNNEPVCVRMVTKKCIYPCSPCNKNFESTEDLQQHQRLEHFECDNCFKYFSQEGLDDHRNTQALLPPDDVENRICCRTCSECGHKNHIVFVTGESFVDHMNDHHRSLVGFSWFQCVPCQKFNRRYYNRYYPTKRSLQLHLATVHSQGVVQQQQAPQQAQQQPTIQYVDQAQMQQILGQAPQGNQQLQIVQTHGESDQPQLITLYTWGSQ